MEVLLFMERKRYINWIASCHCDHCDTIVNYDALPSSGTGTVKANDLRQQPKNSIHLDPALFAVQQRFYPRNLLSDWRCGGLVNWYRQGWPLDHLYDIYDWPIQALWISYNWCLRSWMVVYERYSHRRIGVLLSQHPQDHESALCVPIFLWWGTSVALEFRSDRLECPLCSRWLYLCSPTPNDASSGIRKKWFVSENGQKDGGSESQHGTDRRYLIYLGTLSINTGAARRSKCPQGPRWGFLRTRQWSGWRTILDRSILVCGRRVAFPNGLIMFGKTG